jgi:hypothetical protein
MKSTHATKGGTQSGAKPRIIDFKAILSEEEKKLFVRREASTRPETVRREASTRPETVRREAATPLSVVQREAAHCAVRRVRNEEINEIAELLLSTTFHFELAKPTITASNLSYQNYSGCSNS